MGEVIGPALGGIGLSLGGADGFLFAFWLFVCAGLAASLREFNNRIVLPGATMPAFHVPERDIAPRAA